MHSENSQVYSPVLSLVEEPARLTQARYKWSYAYVNLD